MKAQVGPSSKELKTEDDLAKFLAAEKESSIVGFFEKETDLKAAFMKIADKLREKVRFAHTTFKGLLEKQGVKDGVLLFRPAHLNNKFEESSVKYTGDANSADIHKFITNNLCVISIER